MRLASGPRSARQLVEYARVSQATVSRILNGLESEIIRIGAARSIQYTLRDRRLPDIPIYRVDAAGKVRKLGLLIPVRPEGFVMRQEEGITQHSEGIPWWLFDMRPQGYLGRAYAAHYSAVLGLPERLADWTDTHALRALLAHGQDVIGNLLLGDLTRDRFLATPLPVPIKPEAYVQLARDAAQGETPGSSAGGEQPKFTTFADTSDGPRFVMVKFSEREAGPVSERWRTGTAGCHFSGRTGGGICGHWCRRLAHPDATVGRRKTHSRFSSRFAPCIGALEHHVQIARAKIERLG